MNDQEIFDTVAKHLFAQGYRCVNEAGDCVYRGPNNTACAVGALMTNDQYVPEMDKAAGWGGTGLDSLLSRFGDRLPIWFKDNETLLRDLQDVHDASSNWYSTEYMKAALSGVAECNLVSPAILEDLKFADDR